MPFKQALSAALVLSGFFAIVGCTKNTDEPEASLEDRLCEHAMGIEEFGMDSREECDRDIASIREQCANGDEVLECLLEANSRDESERCEVVCQQG